jgi:hypothetical protein
MMESAEPCGVSLGWIKVPPVERDFLAIRQNAQGVRRMQHFQGKKCTNCRKLNFGFI